MKKDKYKIKERKREKERETDRQTDRQREREREREKERKKERSRQEELTLHRAYFFSSAGSSFAENVIFLDSFTFHEDG